MFIRLSEDVSVAGQLATGDIETAAAAGFVTIVNNRPDGEAPNQPTSAVIETATKAAGLRYSAIPITNAGFSMMQIEAMSVLLTEARGPILAFCRSGMRSAMLWALASAHSGDDPDRIIATAATAGYDVSSLTSALRQLAER